MIVRLDYLCSRAALALQVYPTVTSSMCTALEKVFPSQQLAVFLSIHSDDWFAVRPHPGLGAGWYTIRLTCTCDLYPLTPYICMVKMGFTGVYIFFYFCSKTMIVGTR